MILEAKNIEYVYKSQKDRKVLGDISVRFEEKKFYAIIGASGAGKTTVTIHSRFDGTTNKAEL